MGECFTWSNKHEDVTFTKERHGRAIANQAWLQLYNGIRVEAMVARSLDHKPILLSCRLKNFQGGRKRKLFRYEGYWNMEEECSKDVGHYWK